MWWQATLSISHLVDELVHLRADTDKIDRIHEQLCRVWMAGGQFTCVLNLHAIYIAICFM